MAQKMQIPIMQNGEVSVAAELQFDNKKIDEIVAVIEKAVRQVRSDNEKKLEKFSFYEFASRLELYDKALLDGDSISGLIEGRPQSDYIRKGSVAIEQERNRLIEYVSGLDIEKKMNLFKSYADDLTVVDLENAMKGVQHANWLPDIDKSTLLDKLKQELDTQIIEYRKMVEKGLFNNLVLGVCKLLCAIIVYLIIYENLWHWVAYLMLIAYIIRVYEQFRKLKVIQEKNGDNGILQLVLRSIKWV